MSRAAIEERGEAVILIDGKPNLLRPTFAALVAAEAELGSLFELVERAASGALTLSETVTMFWHCLVDNEGLSREALGEAVVRNGIAAVTPALRIILQQIIQGR